MQQARFDNILNSQTSVAQKIFNCIPVDATWTLRTIYHEVKRRQVTTGNRSVVEKCLYELTEAGLLKEGPKGTFHRIHPHRQQAQVIKRDPVVHQRKVDVPQAPSVALTSVTQAVPVKPPVTSEPAPAVEPAAVVEMQITPPAVEEVVASTKLQSERMEEAPQKAEDVQVHETASYQGEEVMDHAPLMPIAYHERYMELRLEHGVTMLRELAFLVDSPVSQTMLELALDFDRLKQLVRRVPALERQPVTPVDNPHKEPTVFSVKPSDQTELKQAIAACDARAAGSKVSKTAEYRCWSNIRYCRGIEVDPRWKNSFENFLTDVGYRPNESARLLRIDKSRGWTKSNVNWKMGSKVVAFLHTPPSDWPTLSK